MRVSRLSSSLARILLQVDWAAGAQQFKALFSRKTVSSVLAGAVLLTACATPTGNVPIPISCMKDAPAKPATTDEAALKAMDDYAATITVWTERLTLKAYSEKADAIIQACR